jgi:CRISPR-associated protein Csd1
MILQALNRYYEILSRDSGSDIAPPGYSKVGVSFALNLSDRGELLDVFPLFVQEQRGKKTVDAPRRMLAPEQLKRSGIAPPPNFLCDNSAYMLGISEKDTEKPGHGPARFDAFRSFNLMLLSQVESAAARAAVAFLTSHDPQKAREHPSIAPHLETLLKGGNLVLMHRGDFIQDDPQIKQMWEAYKAGQDAVVMQCLVTGETAPIARLHPSLKGVSGGQPTGVTLVGFNDRAYESFGRVKEQGLNAPVSQKAVFAYSTALNYLLSRENPNQPIKLGDTTLVYWAESERQEYAAEFASFFGAGNMDGAADGSPEGRIKAEARLGVVAGKVRGLQALDPTQVLHGLDPNVRFYVLGLAPNAARVSVRFFIAEPFVALIERILQHHRDLEVVREVDSQPEQLSIRTLVNETVSRKARDQEASPLLAGAVVRAILTGTPYPAGLFYAIINRVRADMDDQKNHIQKINRVRAAIVKAYLLRKYRRQSQNPYQEVLEMSLNETATNPAYVLGRLFAVLEKVQKEAVNPEATIKDRYFTSACASPASVFPVLLRLSQHHIAKAEWGRKSDERIQELLNLLDLEKRPFPAHLPLDEQGVFILGYYHQRAAFYTRRSSEGGPATAGRTAEQPSIEGVIE